MGMSVARAQQEISAREFAEWAAFDRMNPGEPERGDYRAALIAFTVARALGAENVKLEDFVLEFGKRKENEPNVDVDARNKALVSLLLGAPKNE